MGECFIVHSEVLNVLKNQYFDFYISSLENNCLCVCHIHNNPPYLNDFLLLESTSIPFSEMGRPAP